MFSANPLWTPPREAHRTFSAKRDASIVERLADAIAVVHRLPPSPDTRELRTRLARYSHVVRGWTTVSPTEEQREALREQLDEILRRLASGARSRER